MIGPIKQKCFDQRSVAGNVSRTQAGSVGSLGKTAEGNQARVAVASKRVRRRERAERGSRLVEIDLGIALVGGDHEIVPIGQLEQVTPLVLTHHPAGGIVGRADIEQLRPSPDRVRHVRPSRGEIARDETIDVIRRRAGQQRGAFVDLIERIGNDDRRAGAAGIDDRLRKREQRLAAAEHRQHLRCRVERDQSMTSLEPLCDRLAQRGGACRCGIIRESLRACRKRVEQQPGRRMARLTDRQADGRLLRIRHHACEKRSQTFERIWPQLREVRIQKNVARKNAVTN